MKKQLFSNRTTNEKCYLNSTASKISSICKEEDLVLCDERNKENNCNLNATGTILATTKRDDFFTDFDLANASTVDLLSLEDQIITSPIQKCNRNVNNWELKNQFITSVPKNTRVSEDQTSLDFSLFEDLVNGLQPADENSVKIVNILGQNSLKNGSSATELRECDATVEYDLNDESHVAISFGVTNCKSVDVTTKNSSLKRIKVTNKDNDINLDCELQEYHTLSCESEIDENMNETISSNLQKRSGSGVAVNLEIKKKKPSTEDVTENSKVLILKTDAIEKLSHVIVQPPNYTLVKRQTFDRNKFQSTSRINVGQAKDRKNGKSASTLKQIPIDCFLAKDIKKRATRDDTDVILVSDDETEMNKNIGVADALKCDRGGRALYKFDWKSNESPRAGRVQSCKADTNSHKRQDVKPSSSEAPRAPSLRAKNDSISSHSPRKNIEGVPFNMGTKTKSGRISGSARSVPYHKIVAGN